MARYILYCVFAGILAGIGWFLWQVWTKTQDVAISFHGSIAIILVAIFGTLITGGLMVLMFYSSRKGYDTEAHHINQQQSLIPHDDDSN